jgi:uncharacterized protein (DUF2235 family)
VQFRAAHSHPTFKIKFVGVWDTVGAMGIPFSFLGLFEDKDEFYDTKIGPNIRIARHALAIDELREDFEATVWTPRPGLDLKQVWFCGAHADIGGGYAPDRDGTTLGDNALAWMMKEAEAAGLSWEGHLGSSLRPNPLSTVHVSRRSFYRIKDKYYRPIDHELGDVLIHRSVKKRFDSDRDYRPQNLVRYLKVAGGWGNLVA